MAGREIFDTLKEGTGALSRKGMRYEFIQAQLFYEAVFCYAARKGYKLSLTKSYQSKTKKLLRFSKSGNASIERRYSTRIIASYKKKPPLDKINDKEALKE